MNKKFNKTYCGMKKLGEYLNSQSQNKVFLTFSKIEEITNIKLPKSAKNAKWWSNNSSNKISQCWLSNNYKVFEAETIPDRMGIYFKRMDNPIDRLFNNPIFKKIIASLITIICSVIASIIVNTIKENKELKNIINNYYHLTNIEEINTTADDIIYKLDNKKDYFTICNVLHYQCCSLMRESNKNIQIIMDVCSLGEKYAQKSGSEFYQTFFLNSMGEIYLNKYNYSFNSSDAYKAIYYLNVSDDIHGILPCTHKILEECDINFELESIRTSALLTNTYYKLIQNGEYTTEEFDLNVNTTENVFFRLYQSNIKCGYKLFSTNNKLNEKYSTDVYSYDKQLYWNVVINNIKCSDILYIMGKKENIDWVFNEVFFSVEDSIDMLKNYLQIANKDYNLENVYQITYELMRLCFFEFLQGNEQYIEEFEVYATYCLNTKTLSSYEIDRSFLEIKRGYLLDLYIDELEQHLKDITFSNNTSYYSYLSLELAIHYYYKALELKLNDADKDLIYNYINLSKSSCLYANFFFENQINKRAYNELKILQTDIEKLEDELCAR